MKNKYKKIVICDPRLKNMTGHFWETVSCFRNAAKSAGFEVEVLGCEDLPEELAEKENICRFFQEKALHPTLLMALRIKLEKLYLAIKMSLGYKISIKNEILEKSIPTNQQTGFPEKLRNYIRKSYFQKSCDGFLKRISQYLVADDTLFFFMTFFEPEIAGATKWLNSLNKNVAGAFICLGFVPTPHYFRMAVKSIKSQPLKHSLAFFAMREPQIAEYRKYGLDQAYLIPMPHAYRKEFESMVTDHKKSGLIISFLGGARVNKGFHWLPDLIVQLKKYQELPEYYFEIQVNYRNVAERNELNILKEAGEKLEQTDAVLIKEELSTMEYQQLLLRSDIILLPYPHDARPLHNYRVGTSGILSEAIAAGKVTVVPANTWMAEIVEKYGAGMIFNDENDFAQTVKETILNYQTLKTAAEKAQTEWRNWNCPENTLNIILSKFEHTQ